MATPRILKPDCIICIVQSCSVGVDLSGLRLFSRGLSVHTRRGADKSLARPGRKQATATEDFYFHISYL